MTEQQDELERFGSALIRLVRDRSIAACDRLASGTMIGPTGERWRSILADPRAREAIEALIPDIVDHTLFELLDAVDNSQLPLAWRDREEHFVPLDELGKGEMAGWLVGSPGWTQKFSSERSVDPFEDLQLEPEP